MTTRRDFIVSTSGLVGASLLAPSALASGILRRRGQLKILVLGGTGFLGPHFVRYAVERGHEVTLFNRGRTNPHLFPELEKLRGDRRASELSELEGEREWDAVVDTSGYVPRHVTESASLLKDRAEQYLFISTLSVYGSKATPDMDEDEPVQRLDDPTVEQVTGTTYGPLKALCEEAAEAEFVDRTCVIRPGLIVGPGDPTDRFTYWPVRVRRGGEVLSPGSGDDLYQVIDVRDLAEFMVHCLERKTNGCYHAITPAGSSDMRSLLKTCRSVSESDASFTWVPTEFLQQQGVAPWQNMPVWIPSTLPGFAGVGQVSSVRAQEAGLTYRTLDDTVRATLEWVDTLEPERVEQIVQGRRAGVSPEREAEVLKTWHESNDG